MLETKLHFAQIRSHFQLDAVARMQPAPEETIWADLFMQAFHVTLHKRVKQDIASEVRKLHGELFVPEFAADDLTSIYAQLLLMKPLPHARSTHPQMIN